MIRRLLTIGVATVIAITAPVLLAGATAPAPNQTGDLSIQAALQPAPDYPDWLFEKPAGMGEPDWSALEACWTDRFTSPNPTPPGCSGQYPLKLWCDWRVDYPDRYWVEQGCGRIAGWGPDFGRSWWQGWGEHPAKDWVARMRAGGQP